MSREEVALGVLCALLHRTRTSVTSDMIRTVYAIADLFIDIGKETA